MSVRTLVSESLGFSFSVNRFSADVASAAAAEDEEVWSWNGEWRHY